MRHQSILNRPRSLAVNVGCGIFAGLFAGLLVAMINEFAFDPSKVRRVVQFQSVLMGLVAYTLTAIALYYVWPSFLRRLIPTWLAMSFLGSLIFVLLKLGSGTVAAWRDPGTMETFRDF